MDALALSYPNSVTQTFVVRKTSSRFTRPSDIAMAIPSPVSSSLSYACAVSMSL